MSDERHECYWCPAEATRTGIERDADGKAREREVCEDCGESCDRAETLHKRELYRDGYGDYLRDMRKDDAR